VHLDAQEGEQVARIIEDQQLVRFLTLIYQRISMHGTLFLNILMLQQVQKCFQQLAQLGCSSFQEGGCGVIQEEMAFMSTCLLIHVFAGVGVQGGTSAAKEEHFFEGVGSAGVARLSQHAQHHCARDGAAVHQRLSVPDDARCTSHHIPE